MNVSKSIFTRRASKELKISSSQIKTFLAIMQHLTKEALKDISDPPTSGDSIDLNIAIPIIPVSKSVDLKEETILTILSKLEDETSHNSKMLDIQCTVSDFVSVTLKRRSIEELASVEAVGRCILRCGTRIDKTSSNFCLGYYTITHVILPTDTTN